MSLGRRTGPCDRLGRAIRLGSLKADDPTGPLVDAYLSWCQRHARTCILLYADRGHFACISYRSPRFDRVLTQEALGRIRHHIDPAQVPGLRRRRILSGNGSEITGLMPEKAEAIAFRIADAAQDSDRTQGHGA